MQAASANRKKLPSQAYWLARRFSSVVSAWVSCGASAARPALTTDARQQLLHALRTRAGIEQRLCGGGLFGVGDARGAHFFDRVFVLIEQPPADLHGRDHHQHQRRDLEDARCFHAHRCQRFAQRIGEAHADRRCHAPATESRPRTRTAAGRCHARAWRGTAPRSVPWHARSARPPCAARRPRAATARTATLRAPGAPGMAPAPAPAASSCSSSAPRASRRSQPDSRSSTSSVAMPAAMATRIARQRAGLVGITIGRQARHDAARTAEGTDRHAAADDLAEGRHVRRDAVAARQRRRAPGGSRRSPHRR